MDFELLCNISGGRFVLDSLASAGQDGARCTASLAGPPKHTEQLQRRLQGGCAPRKPGQWHLGASSPAAAAARLPLHVYAELRAPPVLSVHSNSCSMVAITLDGEACSLELPPNCVSVAGVTGLIKRELGAAYACTRTRLGIIRFEDGRLADLHIYARSELPHLQGGRHALQDHVPAHPTRACWACRLAMLCRRQAPQAASVSIGQELAAGRCSG